MLEASADDIVAWGDREFCPNQTSLRVATDYVRKLGLIRNVAISNKVYGRPLPSIHLLRKYNEGNSMSETQGALLVPRPFLSDGDSAPRQWASRWRKSIMSNVEGYDSVSRYQKQTSVSRLTCGKIWETDFPNPVFRRCENHWARLPGPILSF